MLLLPSSLGASGAYPYRMPTEVFDPNADTVIGTMRQYRVKEEDTMLDIARHFDLGYNELMLLYPEVDPWLPPVGEVLRIPTRWVLPLFDKRGIVINVAELRLYLFLPEIGLVKTYPIGIGVREHPTPFGTFKVVEKEKDPTWDIPPSLRAEFGGRLQIPPGPENPLGAYWIGLSGGSYGIHGTNSPWGIGRLVSHGCIRLYPEDIERLFPLVEVGMPVKIVYEPVKFGLERGKVYVEVHPDIYHRCQDLTAHGVDLALSSGLMPYINLPPLLRALKEKEGIPVDVTRR
ncbi:MAG: L,D-transpeptidase [Deltaproteobacteria bacterium]|nr:MAG: L,D-transpeptidase [Deltaproteobacteria bacterium]